MHILLPVCVWEYSIINFILIHFEFFKVNYKMYVCSQFFGEGQEIAWSVEASAVPMYLAHINWNLVLYWIYCCTETYKTKNNLIFLRRRFKRKSWELIKAGVGDAYNFAYHKIIRNKVYRKWFSCVFPLCSHFFNRNKYINTCKPFEICGFEKQMLWFYRAFPSLLA